MTCSKNCCHSYSFITCTLITKCSVFNFLMFSLRYCLHDSLYFVLNIKEAPSINLKFQGNSAVEVLLQLCHVIIIVVADAEAAAGSACFGTWHRRWHSSRKPYFAKCVRLAGPGIYLIYYTIIYYYILLFIIKCILLYNIYYYILFCTILAFLLLHLSAGLKFVLYIIINNYLTQMSACVKYWLLVMYLLYWLCVIYININWYMLLNIIM